MQSIVAAPITLNDLRLYYEPCQSDGHHGF